MSSPLAEKLVGKTTTFCTVPWSGNNEKKIRPCDRKKKKDETLSTMKRNHENQHYDTEKGMKKY